MTRILAISLLCLSAALGQETGRHQQGSAAVVVFPVDTQVVLLENVYGLHLCTGQCRTLVPDKQGALVAVSADAYSRCGVRSVPGSINVSSSLTRHEQAKALIHEAVHIAQDCAVYPADTGERISIAISDLLESQAGHFIEQAL